MAGMCKVWPLFYCSHIHQSSATSLNMAYARYLVNTVGKSSCPPGTKAKCPRYKLNVRGANTPSMGLHVNFCSIPRTFLQFPGLSCVRCWSWNRQTVLDHDHCTVGSGNLTNFLSQAVSAHSFKNFKML
jgi:hypothetical protein